MNLEKHFKLKSKILSREKSIKVSESNQLIAKLIGFSSYYEYKKSLKNNDGRHIYLKINGDKSTISEKRVEYLIDKSKELHISIDEMCKIFNINKLKNLIDKESLAKNGCYHLFCNMERVRLFDRNNNSSVLIYQDMYFPYKEILIKKRIEGNSNKRFLILSKKALELVYSRDLVVNNYEFCSDAMAYSKYKKNELKEYINRFDEVFIDVYDRLLTSRKEIMDILKTKKSYLFISQYKVFNSINLIFSEELLNYEVKTISDYLSIEKDRDNFKLSNYKLDGNSNGVKRTFYTKESGLYFSILKNYMFDKEALAYVFIKNQIYKLAYSENSLIMDNNEVKSLLVRCLREVRISRDFYLRLNKKYKFLDGLEVFTKNNYMIKISAADDITDTHHS